MTTLTVKEFATVHRVCERTVRTWLAKGAIAFHRTPGGGIRITEPATVQADDRSCRPLQALPVLTIARRASALR